MYQISKKIMLGEYLDVRRFIKFAPKHPIRILSGPRGDGKSTTIKKGLDKEVYINKRKFVGLVRTEDEIKVKKKDIFEEQFPTGQVIGNKIYDIKKKDYYTKQGKKKTNIHEQYLVGMIIPLNLSSKYRSGASFKEYDIVIWDEFQDEQNRYLKDEMDKLFSILETVLRTKTKADIFLISNEVCPWCPLYDYIKIKEHPEPGTIMFFNDLKIAYYRTKTSAQLREKKAKSIVSSFSKNSEYQDFAYNNVGKENPNANIITNPHGLKEKFNIMFLNNHFGVYTFTQGGYVSGEPHGGKTYPLTNNDAITHGYQPTNPDWFYSIASSALKSNALYFSSGIVKEVIAQFIGK